MPSPCAYPDSPLENVHEGPSHEPQYKEDETGEEAGEETGEGEGEGGEEECDSSHEKLQERPQRQQTSEPYSDQTFSSDEEPQLNNVKEHVSSEYIHSPLSGTDDTNSISSKKASSFIPCDFPRVYPSGKLPLRIQIFNDKKILKTVLTRPKKGLYSCNHCSRTFIKFGDLLDHIDEFEIKRSFKCSNIECPYKIVGFSKFRQLRRHEMTIHSGPQKFKCQVEGCLKSFGRVDLLNRHIRNVHENLESRFNKKLHGVIKSRYQRGKAYPSTSPSVEVLDRRLPSSPNILQLLNPESPQQPQFIAAKRASDSLIRYNNTHPQQENNITKYHHPAVIIPPVLPSQASINPRIQLASSLSILAPLPSFPPSRLFSHAYTTDRIPSYSFSNSNSTAELVSQLNIDPHDNIRDKCSIDFLVNRDQ